MTQPLRAMGGVSTVAVTLAVAGAVVLACAIAVVVAY